MGRIVASDLYPAVRKFLPEHELARTLKAFNNETGEEEGGGAKKKARILKGLELVEACQLWYTERGTAELSGANLYPAFRRFLQETGLARTLKAFNKEVAEDEDGGAKKKQAKILAEMELTEACQLWYDSKVSEAGPAASPKSGPAASPKTGPAKSPKSGPAKSPKTGPAASPKTGPAKAHAVEKENGTKKRKAVEVEAEAEAEEPEAEEGDEEKSKKRKHNKDGTEKKEKVKGVFFQREDWDKWTDKIKDERLKDNTHQAKAKYGDAAGDSWGDKAAESMIKVKGKGFRKEMAKMKRASWRGSGQLDQGVNSIRFSDSEDE